MTETKVPPRELVKRAARVPTGMTYHVIWVNAELARDLLQWNQEPQHGQSGTNRKASEKKIAEYAAGMLGDEWRINPQPVVYSQAGWQEDGQQRLKAVVLAAKTKPDISVPLTICVDAPDSSRLVIDLGKRRTAADFLQMAGHTSTINLAAALKMLWCYDNIPHVDGNAWRRVRWTPHLQADVIAANPMIKEGLRVAMKSAHLFSRTPAGVLWYLAYRAIGDGGEMANWFMRGLEKGVDPDVVDARYLMREGLARAASVHRARESDELLGIGIKAFNAWATGCSDDYTFGLRKLERYPKMITAEQALPLAKLLTPGETKRVEEAAKAEADKLRPVAY